MQRLLAFLVLAGCGFDQPSVLDAPFLPELPPPPPDAAPRCSPSGRFGEPQLVTSVSSPAREDEITLTADELEAYFIRDDGTGQDVFRARRGSRDQPWGPEEKVAAVSSPRREGSVDISPDGLTLYISRDTGTSSDIFVATRTNTVAEFSDATPLANINTNAGEEYPSINAAGTVLYFNSSRSGSIELYRAERAVPNLAFEAPTVVGNTPDYFSPVVTDDGLGVYFARFVGGTHQATFASRASTSAPFDGGMHLTELTGQFGGWPAWLSNDLCRMYFALGDKPGGPGDLDLWVAERSPL